MAAGKAKYIFLNGEIIPFTDAKTHVLSVAMKFAASVYDAWRGYWNPDKQELFVFRLEDHVVRFFESAKIANIEIPYSKDEIIGQFMKLVKANNIREDIHCRMIGFVDEVDGPLLSTSPVSLTIAAIPYGSYFAAGEKGLNCCVNSWGRISDNVFPPRLKAAANYHNSRLGGIQAKKDGYDGSIFLNQNGKVTEAEGSNFFMVRKGTPITPGITCNILEGITRSTLIRLFDRELHLQVIEREIDRTELYVAEEAFLCGSAAEVTPIISIDRRKVGDGKFGPVTEKIRKTYFDLVRGKLNGYEDWLLPVYKTK